MHVPPVGHSALSWQPATHCFVVGLQPKPGGQPPAAAQSVGSSLHAPRSHTWPEEQVRPQPPQLFSSASGSTQPLWQSTSEPLQPVCAPPPVAVPPSVAAPPPVAVPPSAPVPPPPPVDSKVWQRPKMQACPLLHTWQDSPFEPHAKAVVTCTH